MSEWISVEDRLPELNKIVLIFCRSGPLKDHICFIGKLTKDGYEYFTNLSGQEIYSEYITHWMPLPEFPK